jgi:hypothetical protein
MMLGGTGFQGNLREDSPDTPCEGVIVVYPPLGICCDNIGVEDGQIRKWE